MTNKQSNSWKEIAADIHDDMLGKVNHGKRGSIKPTNEAQQPALIRKHQRAIKAICAAILEINTALYPTEQLSRATEAKLRRLL